MRGACHGGRGASYRRKPIRRPLRHGEMSVLEEPFLYVLQVYLRRLVLPPKHGQLALLLLNAEHLGMPPPFTRSGVIGKVSALKKSVTKRKPTPPKGSGLRAGRPTLPTPPKARSETASANDEHAELHRRLTRIGARGKGAMVISLTWDNPDLQADKSLCLAVLAPCNGQINPSDLLDDPLRPPVYSGGKAGACSVASYGARTPPSPIETCIWQKPPPNGSHQMRRLRCRDPACVRSTVSALCHAGSGAAMPSV